MISIPHVTIPGSSIKSPGTLLSMVKTEIPSRDNSLSSDIEIERNFKENSSQEISIELSPKTHHNPTPSYQDYVTLLSHYNIQVNNNLNTQQASAILSHIVQEILQLPENFVRKLQLQISITNHPDVFNERGFFRSDDLLNENKINDKLYRLLFEHVLLNFPTLLSLWSEDDQDVDNYERERISTQVAKIHQMEAAFYAIMQNRKHPKTKPDVIKFRKILISLDPVSFSLDWFKERNLKFKKKLRVQFEV